MLPANIEYSDDTILFLFVSNLICFNIPIEVSYFIAYIFELIKQQQQPCHLTL